MRTFPETRPPALARWRAELRRRRRLANELSAYRTPAERRELAAVMARHTADETREMETVLRRHEAEARLRPPAVRVTGR